MMPQPTPAPIHDIADPWVLPTLPLPVILAAAIALLMCSLWALWYFVGRHRQKRTTPRQRAEMALAALRQASLTPYEIGVRASDILRTYVRDEFGLDAVTRTSLEFLQSIRENPVFTIHEKGRLAAFLEAADLLKYARVDAAGGEIIQLLDTADGLIHTGQKEVVAK